MGGKKHQRRSDPLLQVAGFKTVGRRGRFLVLECEGGNARDAVHALRDDIKAKNDGEIGGVILRGLSRRYDLLYQLDRVTIDGREKTAVKFSCWHASSEATGRTRLPPVYVVTATPNVCAYKGRYRVKVGRHYVGTFDTYPEAVSAKALYAAGLGRHPGPDPSFDVNCALQKLVKASVQS